MSEKQSKRKRKQAHEKKPRTEAVYGVTAGVVNSLTVTFDPETGTVHIPEIDPASIQRRLTHAREGKDDKIIYAAPATDFSQSKTQFDELCTQFDYLVAVDTNTLSAVSRGYRVSAAMVYCIPASLKDLAHKQVVYAPLGAYLIVDRDLTAIHEPLGWDLVIQLNLKQCIKESKRVALIVDHALGNHSAINARDLPYHNDSILPEGVSLIYASSDKSDTFANELLGLCDKGASEVLKHVRDGSIDSMLVHPGFKTGVSSWCYPVRLKVNDPRINQDKI
ncbi:hypothetical protein [Pseudomonas monteilii]|uniref:hypothetical protein n=1 Tax=Pseudomonas monteilii TaxID=76759 RepID=UPI0036EDC24F